MIPSLVAGEIRSALVDYLATTFSLADDDVRDTLAEFLTDEDHGIFRGPYLRMRTPFRTVDDSWSSPLGWLPAGFVPYAHQAAAFERLSNAAGREPQPTLVTTGTGSGKTECFLFPILDHCARQRDAARRGIKALILYPMNALATDQAGRLAKLIADERRLAGLRAGLYIGENGSHTEMGADHLIDDRHALRANPPEVLLTNYKMLDFLLLRREDHDLWATNDPDTLRYVVLDEFHTYDGAQGTDVAMLLRRLGATLRMTVPGRPLGAAAPVATSATMGNEPNAAAELRDFAGKVFGVRFDPDAVIVEHRLRVDEACGIADHELPVPDPAEVAGLPHDDLEPVAAAFCIAGTDLSMPASALELGETMLAHPVTRAVLAAVAAKPRPLAEAASEVAKLVPEWNEAGRDDPSSVEGALVRFLALVSVARREVGGREVPLFSLEVQLWMREVSRLLRAVAEQPAFRWMDSPGVLAGEADPERTGDHDGDHHSGTVRAETRPTGATADSSPVDSSPVDSSPVESSPVDALPAVSCRRCGHSGWMARASELHEVLSYNPEVTYRAALDRSPSVRVLMRAHPQDPAAQWFDPAARRVVPTPSEGAIAVHVTADEDAARKQTCPACGERNAVLFVGLAVASLASVSINTMFGSTNVEPEERKLLAFTDSVQDASHRASFFTGRTHRFNLRTLMSRALQDSGDEGTDLAGLGERLVAEADTPRARYELVAPDLLRDVAVRSVWSDAPDPQALRTLAQRTGFEVDLEFGLRSRVGRTLEQSVAAVGWVDLGDRDEVESLALEAVRDVLGEVGDETTAGLSGYLLGIGERLRSSGAIRHALLEPFVDEGGKQWFIWGGRPRGLPPFTSEVGRPTFVTTATSGDFDSITALGTTPTWWLDWAQRTLGLDPGEARAVNERVLSTLAGTGDAIVATRTVGGSTVYGLDRRAVRVTDIGEVDGAPEPSTLRCDLCGLVHIVVPHKLDDWVGVACRRYRCPGHYMAQPPADSGYYRRFYRQGRTRRVVAGEHTGLLSRREREALEAAFAQGTAPDAPNVLAATPTLEMGIDIGDLSSVMLTSVPRNPASYIQRVGRAGRATGNALVTTFVRSDSHGLYYLAQPEAMLDGAVRPPSCYLEASETLQRQFTAYLIDRLASGDLDNTASGDLGQGEALPAVQIGSRIDKVIQGGYDTGGLFRTIIDASMSDPAHVESFIASFGDHLGEDAAGSLRRFAAGGIEVRLKDATDDWYREHSELVQRGKRLRAAIDRLEALDQRDEDTDAELRSLLGQRSAVIKLAKTVREEYPLSALERLGVLPNYTLVDDAVTLSATLWSRSGPGAGGTGDEYHTEIIEYDRPGAIAIREFAPGNTFYAGGHRHRVDALEIGSAAEPLYETWRICPECAFADLETAGEPPALCPRCGGAAIADVGSRHQVLRLRKALATGSEEAARVYDERDERTRESYETATLVDIADGDVRGAWLLEGHTFGAEFVTRVRLRTFNLGIDDRPGDTVPMAGIDRHVSRFTVCRHCGAVRDVRNDRRGERPGALHQGWCKVRSGALREQWDPIVLVHELATEAIRFLVPVSMYEVEERLASFKAALKLGIRAGLGGNPDHLEVTTADAPNRGGQGRRRFLVLYDQVPGGTGYLAPLADPGQVRRFLEAARDHISRCACRAEGRPACHRCLLGVVDRSEYALVRRDIARELLDGLLGDWQTPSRVDTVAGASIAQVEESELERRFKVALRHWAENEQRADVTWTRVPGRDRYEAFELTIGFGGDVVRYRFDEQAGLSNVASTLPDFLIRRMDARAPEIAVYLDGLQFHASQQHNRIAADSTKRAELRAESRLVWNLTWRDVEQFHSAVTAEIPRNAPDRELMSPAARARAKAIHHHRPDALISIESIEQNPVALLLDFLVRPEVDQWRQTVLSAVAGVAAAAGLHDLDVSTLGNALDDALRGCWPTEIPEPDSDPVAYGTGAVTPGGLPFGLVLDATAPDEERWSVFAVLDDSPEALADPDHQHRWADWLPWSNLLQFLGQPHDPCAAVIAAASQASSGASDELWLRHLCREGTIATPRTEPSSGDSSERPTGQAELPAEQLANLELMDPAVAELTRPVLEVGAPGVIAGHELADGSMIEAAWPDQRVAVVTDGQVAPDGWQSRHVTDWTVDELAAALQSAAPTAQRPTGVRDGSEESA